MSAELGPRARVLTQCGVATVLASGLLLGLAFVTASASGRVSGQARPNCPELGPVRVHHNRWPRARNEMAPRGALRIQLCRYAGLNAHPRFKLLGSDLVVSSSIRHQIISRLDALKPYTGPPLHCPADSGKAVGITLFYRGGHQVRIAVDTSGCPRASNGDIKRLISNRAGQRLLRQLEALTPRQES